MQVPFLAGKVSKLALHPVACKGSDKISNQLFRRDKQIKDSVSKRPSTNKSRNNHKHIVPYIASHLRWKVLCVSQINQ